MRSRLPGAGSRDALLESQVFRQLGPELHDQLFSRMTERQYEPGETLIRQGDPGDCLMLLLEGEALVLVHDATSSQQIARFGKGDVVGEMALLTGESRTADVVADTGVRTLVLEVGAFQELAMQHPELGMVLTQLVADRLGEGSLDGLSGKKVGKYEIGRCLGRGAMAVVYEAQEVDTDQRVALKMMSHRGSSARPTSSSSCATRTSRGCSTSSPRSAPRSWPWSSATAPTSERSWIDTEHSARRGRVR